MDKSCVRGAINSSIRQRLFKQGSLIAHIFRVFVQQPRWTERSRSNVDIGSPPRDPIANAGPERLKSIRTEPFLLNDFIAKKDDTMAFCQTLASRSLLPGPRSLRCTRSSAGML